MNKEIEKNNERFEYLDGLRGAAAVFVFLCHFRYAFFVEINSSSLYTFIWHRLYYFFLGGPFQVAIFFVLSAFVLTFSFMNNSGFLKKQFFKRYYRLITPVFITGIIYCLLNFFNYIYIDSIKVKILNYSELISAILNFLFFYQDDSLPLKMNEPLWSIIVELVWSYVLFLIFLLSRYFSLNWLILVLFFASQLLFSNHFSQFSILFCAGALIAVNYNYILLFFQNSYILYAYNIVFFSLVYLIERFHPFVFSFLFNFIAILFLITILINVRLKQLFFKKLFTLMGRCSFAFYLIHFAILGSISKYIYDRFVILQNDLGLVFFLIISFFVTFLFSYIFTILIDEPLMKLFDKFYKKTVNAIQSK